jgi:hypothetical protein
MMTPEEMQVLLTKVAILQEQIKRLEARVESLEGLTTMRLSRPAAVEVTTPLSPLR